MTRHYFKIHTGPTQVDAIGAALATHAQGGWWHELNGTEHVHVSVECMTEDAARLYVKRWCRLAGFPFLRATLYKATAVKDPSGQACRYCGAVQDCRDDCPQLKNIDLANASTIGSSFFYDKSGIGHATTPTASSTTTSAGSAASTTPVDAGTSTNARRATTSTRTTQATRRRRWHAVEDDVASGRTGDTAETGD